MTGQRKKTHECKANSHGTGERQTLVYKMMYKDKEAGVFLYMDTVV